MCSLHCVGGQIISKIISDGDKDLEGERTGSWDAE